MNSIRTTTLLGLLVVLIIVGGLIFALVDNTNRESLYSIQNFEDCAAAGYPIMESYPERCATPDGRTFVNEQQQATSSEQVVFNGCAVAGCSAQLCVSAEEAEGLVTDCMYRAEYACYKEASCEPQANGKCGWTETAELKQCLGSPPAPEGMQSSL